MSLRKTGEDEYNKEEIVPFNMSMLYYVRLNKIMEEKDRCAISGDYVGWYRCLSSIFRNVEFRIDDNKKIENILNEAKEFIFNSLPKQAIPIMLKKAEDKLSIAESMLLLQMDKKGMIFPKIETNMGVEAVRKKYGLKK